MAEQESPATSMGPDDPVSEVNSGAGSSPAQRARSKPRRTMLLKHAAPKLGYKSVAAIQYWITKQGAPAEKDQRDRWVVDFNEIHAWAVKNAKKVHTLPFAGDGGDATDAPDAGDEIPLELELQFDPSLLPTSRKDQIRKCQDNLSFLMLRLERLSRAHNLDTGAIQRLGQTIKSVSEELRQLEKAEAQSEINDGRYIAREDVDRSVAAMATAWIDGLGKSESEAILSLVRAIDDAVAGGADRDSRRRMVEQVVAQSFLLVRSAIAACITEHTSSPPIDAATEGDAA